MKQAQSIQSTQGFFMPFSSCHFPRNIKYSVFIHYASVVQLQARGPDVAHRRVFSGPQKHFEKNFKVELCWKACEITFVSLNYLRCIKCICTRTINNMFFCMQILFFVLFIPLTLRWATCLDNFCVFYVPQYSLSWRVHLAQWTQHFQINLSIYPRARQPLPSRRPKNKLCK